MATAVAKHKHVHGKTSVTDCPTPPTNVSAKTVIVDVDKMF